MAFSRIRKSLPGGDFDRSANQQRVLRGIQSRIATRADQPGFIERGVVSVMRNMDTNLSPAELFELAQVVAQVDPRKIRTLRHPPARSATSAARASSSRTSARPAGTATPPAATRPLGPC